LGCVPAHGARAPTRTASDRSHRVSTPWMNRHVLPTVAAVDRDEGVPVPPKDGSHRAQPLLDRRTMLRFVGGAAIALPLGACAAGAVTTSGCGSPTSSSARAQSWRPT